MEHHYPSVSLADVTNTVFIIMNAKPGGTASILVLTAAPQLQDEISGYQFVSPGVHRAVWSVDQAKRIARCFRDIGYSVLVYKYKFVAEWFKRISGLIEATDHQDNFDATAMPSIDFDLSAISAVLPTRRTHVELCGGGAPLFMCRPPTPVEVYNDCDFHMITLFDQLRESKSFQWFFLLSKLFPIDTYLHPTFLRKTLRQVEKEDAVIISYLWYRCLHQVSSYANTSNTTLLPAGGTLDALQMVDPDLPGIHGRLLRMQHENNQWAKVIDIYDSDDTFFWVDPSMHGHNSVRVGSKSEDNSFDALLLKLNTVKGAVALYLNTKDPHSGFQQRSEFFSDPDNGWTANEFKSSTVWLKNATFKED